MAASLLFGAQVISNGNIETNYLYDAIGTNSATFTVGDPLTLSSGLLAVASATSTIVGIAAKTQTFASNNQTVAQVAPGYTPVSEATLFFMPANGNFTGNATDAGTYYKLTGTTGAIQVDQVSGVQTTTARVVEIVQVDPYNRGNLNEVSVRFVKTPYTNVQITA